MKIFISHAIKDKVLITQIKKTLEPHNIVLHIAEHYVDMENTITTKIEKLIKQSDMAIFLLTKSGFNSKFVQQEIGYIHNLKLPTLQIVEKGLQKKIAGFIFGKDFIELDPTQPELALEKTKNILLEKWNEIQLKLYNEFLQFQQFQQFQAQIQKQKMLEYEVKKKKEDNQAKIALGVLGGLLLLGFINED
jgi:hypothetical protein